MPDNDNNFPATGDNSLGGDGRYRGEYRGQYNGQPFGGGMQEGDEIDLRRLTALLWRHKWLIVTVTFVTTVLAGAYAWNTMPIYESSGTMMIKDSEGKNPLGSGGEGIGQVLASSYGIGAGSTIKNELQILQSRSLSDEVADKLLEEPILENGNMYPILWETYPEDSVLASKSVVSNRIRNKLNVSRVDENADVVEVSFESPSPKAASNLVDRTMSTYKEISTEQNRRMASSAIDFLSQERARIKKELDDASERLRQFMNEKGVVQVDAQAQQLISTISELESRKQEVRGQLVAAESGIENYKEQLNNIKPGLADTYSEGIAPKMQRYQYRLAELETEKMLMLQRNPELRDKQDTEPSLMRLNEQIKLLKEQINKQAEQLLSKSDQYLGFLGSPQGNLSEDITEIHRKLVELTLQKNQSESQLEVLNERLAEQQSFFEDLPDNMIQLARLKREVSINEKLYNTVANQYAEMQLWRQTQFGLGRVIDYGYEPGSPVKPQKRMYLLVGLILGGILSVGYIFVRSALNTSIDGAEKLEDKFHPLLAVIPNIDKIVNKKFEGRDRVTLQEQEISTNLITLLDNISPEAEAFRRLTNNILYSDPDEDYQTIMITSSSKGEGKTTIASNLGVTMAEAGKKVALVDVDFRRPMIHKFFGLDQSPGLIEIIFNEAGKDECMQQTLVNNVTALATGRRPPNPAAVNQSERLREVINELKGEYDHIILDTAPYGIITDAAPLVNLSDGVIVVTKFSQTREAELDQTLQNLERIKAPVIGTVLTAFEYEKSSDYYYSGDYYRYAYRDYYRYHERS